MTHNAILIPAHYSTLSSSQRATVRAAYVERQDRLCYHCRHSLHEHPPRAITDKPIAWERFPGGQIGFLRYPIHLHHDHVTDLTLGAVHAYCNAVLFQYHGE